MENEQLEFESDTEIIKSVYKDEIEYLSSISSLEQIIPPTRSTYIDMDNETFVMKFVIDKATERLFKCFPEEFNRLNNPGILENTIYGDRYYMDDESFMVKFQDEFFWIEVDPENSNYEESFFNYFRVDPLFEICMDQISIAKDKHTKFIWIKIPLVCEADWEKLSEAVNIEKEVRAKQKATEAKVE